MKENKITAIILAGGKSSRFKKDKSRLKIGDKSLTYYQYKKLNRIFKNVYISSKKDKFDFKSSIIYDKQKEYLPIYSLVNLIKKFNKIFIIPVDVPLIKLSSIKLLIKNKSITKDSPFVGFYDKKDLKKLLNNIKHNNYSPRIGKKTITLLNKEMLNLNYKEEYKKRKWEIKKEFKNLT